MNIEQTLNRLTHVGEVNQEWIIWNPTIGDFQTRSKPHWLIRLFYKLIFKPYLLRYELVALQLVDFLEKNPTLLLKRDSILTLKQRFFKARRLEKFPALQARVEKFFTTINKVESVEATIQKREAEQKQVIILSDSLDSSLKQSEDARDKQNSYHITFAERITDQMKAIEKTEPDLQIQCQDGVTLLTHSLFFDKQWLEKETQLKNEVAGLEEIVTKKINLPAPSPSVNAYLSIVGGRKWSGTFCLKDLIHIFFTACYMKESWSQNYLIKILNTLNQQNPLIVGDMLAFIAREEEEPSFQPFRKSFIQCVSKSFNQENLKFYSKGRREAILQVLEVAI